MNYKTWSTTKKIDNILEIDATQYSEAKKEIRNKGYYNL